MAKSPASMRAPLRVIGGRLRGRQLAFPPIKDLRPTPNRVRETLFNWLMPVIQDAVCLDAFAGSGLLGIEALSRGARHVTFVDTSHTVTRHLSQVLQTLDLTGQSRCVTGDVLQQRLTGSFDLVFIDPPFEKNLWGAAWDWLGQCDGLAEDAWVYCESNRAIDDIGLPKGWHVHRQTKAGQVWATLLAQNT